jgi:orotate phosphoribosyltransferase
MTRTLAESLEFSLDDLRRDVRGACLQGPGDPQASEILDPYGFISQPPILRRLGVWIAAQLAPEVNRLVAVGSSALGLALAAGLEQNVPVAFVADGEVFGEFSSGDAAAVVADITRTGHSARATVEVLSAAGSGVEHVFVVWDRSMGALDLLAQVHVPVSVLMEERLARALR